MRPGCVYMAGKQMKKKPSIVHCSVFAAGALCLVPAAAFSAGIRVGNLSRSYAESYNQVNAMRAPTAPAPQMGTVAAPAADNSAGASSASATSAGTSETLIELPIRVANKSLADKIARGDKSAPVSVAQLARCAHVYPDGEFAWDTPTMGTVRGGAMSCVAVVEMRAIGAGANGADAVLARANLASGDTMTCNISEFPETSYTTDALEFLFPADAEPTMDDVVHVMNNEQKKNAGIKIAAGAVVAGLAGNMVGKNERGQDGLLGTGKNKMQSTAIGAVTGAALMAGNAYAGKVGGDVILSTGVNAAAGGVVGNMMASGDSVLRIEECKLPNGTTSKCLWGMLVQGKEMPLDKNAYFNVIDDSYMLCNADDTNCEKNYDLVSVRLEAFPDKYVSSIDPTEYENVPGDKIYHLDNKKMVTGRSSDGSGIYYKVSSAKMSDKQIPALISGVNDKAFGQKRSDWLKIQRTVQPDRIYGRTTRGDAYILTDATYSVSDFYPMMVSSEDGGLIDFGNKARLKGTLTGAGVGGAMGAFVGYQGAQNDIENRWVESVREYKDSLQKVYCITGKRFLGYYNDAIIIPTVTE